MMFLKVPTEETPASSTITSTTTSKPTSTPTNTTTKSTTTTTVEPATDGAAYLTLTPGWFIFAAILWVLPRF